MKFTAAIAAAVLLGAEMAVASPLTRSSRTHRRRSAPRSSHPRIPVVHTGGKTPEGASDDVSYSGNWAGAVLVGTGYTAVYGTFTVPTPSLPDNAQDGETYSASAWVGIDGDTCSSAILQTGVTLNANSDGSTSYEAWYEWLPDYAHDFDGITINAGDEIKLSVEASSTGSGTATIENLTNGDKVSQDFSGESAELCEYNAEWIVEDFQENGSQAPFANFGTVTFTDASAVQNGNTVGLDGAQVIDLEQNNNILASCSIESSSSVSCTYQ